MSVHPRRSPGPAVRGDGRGHASALPPDEVLVAGLCSGDEGTFATLVDAWTPVMLRVARAHVATDEAAADVVRDAWTAAVDGVGRFQGRSSLRAWVFRILDSIARSRGARERRSAGCGCLRAVGTAGPTVDPGRFRAAAQPCAGRWADPPAPWPADDLTVPDGRLRAVVEAALRDLPARERIVVELRDVYGHGWDEVCALLEMTPARQRALLHRGRAAVRARIEEHLASVHGHAGEGEAS
jgi:RNA polymerase sigma-70 factor, ECF subfamily